MMDAGPADNVADSACASLQDDIPEDTWCRILSFVLRSYCHFGMRMVSPFFHQLVDEPFSWQDAVVGVRAADLERVDGQPRFDMIIPKWRFCSRIFADFKDAHTGKQRRATRRCFSLMTEHCAHVTGLSLRNWCLFERDGLSLLRASFPRLRHLELSGCDYISHANCMRIFESYPKLLSFRGTFSPRSAANLEFAEKAPCTLMALGFVSLQDALVLTRLLERCPLEHLWLSRVSCPSFSSSGMADAVKAAPRDGDICSIARTCSELELICCMREGFGGGGLAGVFEPVPGTIETGVVARRCGSSAQLAPNGAMWAPYSQSDDEIWASTV